MIVVEFKGGKTVGDLEIRKTEKQLSLRLPGDFKDFVRTENGATPESNIFSVGAGLDSGVNRFIPIDEIAKEKQYTEPINLTWIPIAWAEGGNYVCLNTAGGAVYFWDHEEPESEYRLSDSFTGFLQLLRPFNPNDMELDRTRVKKAWIDPDFLKSIDNS